ncbi:tyrosine-type recombinase/integrase [Scleromatobacter humisilvae]|uniref:Tyrosine-type recombinase/integrase n=1 Tax=Scleromatobacter humisilvae TaxID=2897159 RepID=A0A9X1YIY0_9BURK|nr:tyrosine-type recombinase/integrase [Scleromatobacter humisilvae]MCK9687354.1 tyrosine-type recombinase/integrase [Scleromatobacter humisilvae]
MSSKTSLKSSTYRARLGPHHFAYLRAWTEGLPRDDAARRYLGLEHGHQLVTLHRQVVDELRALARRRHDSRWRLIGIDVGVKSGIQESKNSVVPPMEEWAEEHGLGDFAYAEQLEAWQEAFPPDVAGDRVRRRSARLRQRQLEVLAVLANAAATPVSVADPLDAWVDPAMAEKLQRAGYLTLGDLAKAVRRGDRWYTPLKGVGVGKAKRIEQHLIALLGGHEFEKSGKLESMNSWSLAMTSSTSALSSLQRAELDGSNGSNRAQRAPTIDAADDSQAVNVWLAATARSPATKAAYAKEAERFILWAVMERKKPLSSCNTSDCLAYMSFLNRVPDEWQSRRKATRHGAGWAPFRGQLGLESRRSAVKVLHRLCEWLTERRYLDDNPWAGVDRSLVDGEEMPAAPESRAFSREVFAHLCSSLPNPAKPGESRNGFLLHFGRYTGLRAAEMVSATLGAMKRNEHGWRIRVVGKGRKPRLVTVPSPAVVVLNQYLETRGLRPLGETAANTPLLASRDNPVDCPTYSALHQSFSAFVRRAMRSSNLPLEERERAMEATQHWLRHTYATRAAEADTPLDVLQAELGHCDPATTARYYAAQERRRQEAMERASR